MKNYYDELEISKNASKEVIERVYKVLAKKYHPDTTQEADKHAAEEKFKVISEAYEILSNDEKRKKYDLELEQSAPSISYDDYINIVNERDTLNNSLNNLKKQFQQSTSNYSNINYTANNTTSNTNHNSINTNTNNYSYNNSTNNIVNNNKYNTKNNSNKTIKNNSKNVRYYNVATGKPVSAFTYYKYKIKQFFSNLFLFILIIIAIFLAINAFLSSDLTSLLKL